MVDPQGPIESTDPLKRRQKTTSGAEDNVSSSAVSSAQLPHSFFGSLFDFSFTSFVTPQLVPIIYAIALVVLGVGVVAGLVTAVVTFTWDPALAGIQLVAIPVIGFGYLIVVRMFLEQLANLLRIGSDLRAIRKRVDRN